MLKEPTVRAQDLPKLPLLCGNCEQIFSKLESYFAKEVFFPILNKKLDEISYNESLRRFIVSISWRTLVTGYSSQVKLHPWIKEYLDKAEEKWRRYLLQKSSNLSGYEHHMFFVSFIKNETRVPKDFQFYALRATDSTLASSSREVFAYTHFPHVFFVSTIVPSVFSNWKSTRIRNKGKFTTKSKIDDYYFWGFLVGRSKALSTSINKPSDNKILRSMEKNPTKFLKSETLTLLIEKSKRERQGRIKNMPKGIEALIDIIDRGVDNPEYNTLQQGWANYVQHMVASSLSQIRYQTAIIIDKLIQSTILLADDKHRNSKCDFETTELIGRFMVNICENRNKQLELLDKALKTLIKKKARSDARLIVVFSFNPRDEEMPFQTAYYAG